MRFDFFRCLLMAIGAGFLFLSYSVFSQTTNYKYDALGRLIKVEDSNKTADYKYDGAGNRSAVSVVFKSTSAASVNSSSASSIAGSSSITSSKSSTSQIGSSAVSNTSSSKSSALSSSSSSISWPIISSTGVTTSYNPWAVWVNGDNFTRDSSITIYDNNNQVWGAPTDYSFNNKTLVTFGLPANVPPSRCNLIATCNLTFKIRNEFGKETTGSFVLPSANILPPTVISTGVAKEYNPWAVWVNGSNFTRNSTVTLYDSNNQVWGSAVGYAFNNSNLVTFGLPANIPPSHCNLTTACNLTFKIRNEYGQETTGSIALPSVNIFPPTVASVGVVKEYNPWAVWVNGSNFTRDTTVTLYDSNNQLWGAVVGYSFNNSNLVTFGLPANIPPSRCNLTTACNLTFKIRNEYGQETTGSIALPSVNIFPPTIASAGVVKEYNPWAIWVNGSNFTRDTTVTLYDSNNQLWGAVVGYSFNSSNLVTFGLPANSPPSRCNQTTSCTITLRIRNEYGQEGTGTVSLPKQ